MTILSRYAELCDRRAEARDERNAILSRLWQAYRAIQKGELHEAGRALSDVQGELSRIAMMRAVKPKDGGTAA